MDDFERTLESIRKEITGKVVRIPGYSTIGRVVSVDETGGLTDEGVRIPLVALLLYHPAKEDYKTE